MQTAKYQTVEDVIKHYTRLGYTLVDRYVSKEFEIIHLRKTYTIEYRKGNGTISREFKRDIFIHRLSNGEIKLYKYQR